jgi:hypothetical protein
MPQGIQQVSVMLLELPTHLIHNEKEHKQNHQHP